MYCKGYMYTTFSSVLDKLFFPKECFQKSYSFYYVLIHSFCRIMFRTVRHTNANIDTCGTTGKKILSSGNGKPGCSLAFRMSSEFKDREVQTLYQGSVPFVSATLHPFYPYNTAITDGPTRVSTHFLLYTLFTFLPSQS